VKAIANCTAGQSITEGFQESSSASFIKVISRSVISSEVPRVSRELSVLITELLITFRGSVSIRLRFLRCHPFGLFVASGETLAVLVRVHSWSVIRCTNT